MIHFGLQDTRAGSGGMRCGSGRKHREVRKGWRDKRPAIGMACVVGSIGEFAARVTMVCQPFAKNVERIQCRKRHRSLDLVL
jgi:hypothetical protein